MEPMSVIGLVESSLSLALQFGSAAKALNDLAAKYKNAKLAIKSLAQNLDILQLSWTRIGQWFQERFEEESLHDDSLTKRVEEFLETGSLVMEALQRDLEAYNVDHLSHSNRSKFIWNEATLQGHQYLLRDQVLSMSLFLQAVNLPTPQARAQLLHESENQFQKSRTSVYSIDSIVPSRMSVSTSQRDSHASVQSQDTIEYRRLSFEKRLFTSEVYMRSSKKVMIRELSKPKQSLKRKDTATATATGAENIVMNGEIIRYELEADSLLATSYNVSTNDNEHVYSHNCSRSLPRIVEGNTSTTITGMTFEEELLLACEQGDNLQINRLAKLWRLAERGLDLHARFKSNKYRGWRGIHVAAMHGHTNVVETLLSNGATIEEEDAAFKWRPLHIAAKSKQGAMLEFLIQKGAQIDAKARYGIQPIHEASASGSIEALEALIEKGALIDCSDKFGYQPLHIAANVPNRSQIITYLSRKGADIEAKTFDGSRPLQMARRSDSTNFDTLIALGAKFEYTDESKFTLQTAISFDSKCALQILLERGADPNRQDDTGKTALHTLAQIGFAATNSIENFQLLLENGADVDLADKEGNQMFHHLAYLSPKERADLVTIEQLTMLALEQGADIDATNKHGLTALHETIYYGKRQLSRLFITSGARVIIETDVLRVKLQVKRITDSQTPKYIVNVWNGTRGSGQQWKRRRDLGFELSADDDGYIDDSRTIETRWDLMRCCLPSLQ